MTGNSLQSASLPAWRRLPLKLALTGLAFGLVSAEPALAQDASTPQEMEADAAVQQDAVKALDAMAAHLRTLKQFKLTAITTNDDVLEDGQLIQIAGQTEFYVRVPNRMKIDVNNDKNQRVYYYDGKTVTQVSPALGYYSVFEAPNTIAKTVIAAEEKYGVELPLADLFLWNAESNQNDKLQAAYFAGPSKILGETCNHYSYMVSGAQVQLWIRAKGDPLPCRMVVVDTGEAERPQYAATLSWDLDAEFHDSLFLFSANGEMGRIEQEPSMAESK
jgi:hypothetical protein